MTNQLGWFFFHSSSVEIVPVIIPSVCIYCTTTEHYVHTSHAYGVSGQTDTCALGLYTLPYNIYHVRYLKCLLWEGELTLPAGLSTTDVQLTLTLTYAFNISSDRMICLDTSLYFKLLLRSVRGR